MKFTGMEGVGDLIQFNVLFVLCSLPVVTIGASATALHYAMRRWNEGTGNSTKDFFRVFRENFCQATVLWLCILLPAAGLGLNFQLISTWIGPAYFLVMVALLLLASYVLLTWSATVFPLLARFDNTIWATAKNALILALSSPARALPAALNVAAFVLALLLPELFQLIGFLWLFLLCAVNFFAAQKLFQPVFSRLEQIV